MSNRYQNKPDFGKTETLLPQIPRVAAIHDISCLGRCALTVIIPVLSALGVQTVPLPTALLSTHTGGFENMFFEELTSQMQSIADHWKSIGADFDAIYSGFLGDAAQIDMIKSFTRSFAENRGGKRPFIAVDPVMGDDGELYSTYTAELVRGIAGICEGADLITPNLTEACYLTGTKFPRFCPTVREDAEELADKLLKKLTDLFGCRLTVVTGIEIRPEKGAPSVLTALSEHGEKPSFHAVPLLPRSYPGTGDVFASVLIGKLLRGTPPQDAVETACEFVCFLTEKSSHYDTPIRDGLVIEPYLSRLCAGNG